MAGFATWNRYAGHPSRSAQTRHALRLKPDHPIGAGQIKETDSQIEALLNRIVEATNGSVISAYEARIEKLERQKIRLAEQATETVPPHGRFEEFIEPALSFLSNPWNIYEKRGVALKRTVLKLAFAEPLRYNRENGYRTAKTTFPFKVLADFFNPKCGMVEGASIELTLVNLTISYIYDSPLCKYPTL